MKKQQESLENMVYQAILNGIFTDEYKPNQIINEQELVQKFGCSNKLPQNFTVPLTVLQSMDSALNLLSQHLME